MKQVTLAFTSANYTFLLEATKCLSRSCLPDSGGFCQGPHWSVEELRFRQDCKQRLVPGSTYTACFFGCFVGFSPLDLHDVFLADG
ncbi:MAG: hypothetical protein WBC09_05650 [Thermoanaerobaculia bacterium]